MNNVILMGRLTKDPIKKKSGTAKDPKYFAASTIAVDAGYVDEDGNKVADFINIVANGGSAKLLGMYFKKGDRILINGRIKNNNWEDEDGNKHYDMQVAVDRIDFIEKKEAGEAPKKGSKKPTKKVEETEEDLPFDDF